MSSFTEVDLEFGIINIAEGSAAATALVLCKDPVALRLLLESLTPFAIRLRICTDPQVAIGLLNRGKFEAFVGDLEQEEEASFVLRQMHLSPANRTAVTFSIGRISGRLDRPDSTFMLHRPLSVESIRSTFRAAFGMVVRERRRYFRCPVEVRVFVQTQQIEELPCFTVNISEGGLALQALNIRDQKLSTVRFTLPGDAGQFFAETRVCWRAKGGELGLEFVSLPRKRELQEWLARKLEESLPESVAELFRGSGNAERSHRTADPSPGFQPGSE